MSDIYSEIKPAEQAKPKENKPFNKQAWAEQKQVEKQSAYAMIDSAVDVVKSDMGKLQTYLDVQSRMDKYSVANALLIMAQQPTATQLKDFEAWKDAGSSVRPKEKGIVILEPGNEYVRADGSTAVSYNTKKLFDVTQTFGKDKVQPEVNRDERIALKALVQNPIVPIKAVDTLEPQSVGAYYDHNEKTVFVRRGLSNTDFFKSVSLELAHAELAKHGNYSRGEQGYKAYCASYMLCKRYGIDTQSFKFEQPIFSANMERSQVRNALTDMRSAMTELNSSMTKAFTQNKTANQKEQSR